MKENIDTVLLGHRVILVPYRKYHVPVSMITSALEAISNHC